MSESNEYTTHPSSEMVKNSPLGKELTTAQCEALSKIAVVRTLKQGDLLFKEGDRDATLYVIVKGSLKAVRKTAAGDVVSLYDLYGGEVAGVMGFMDNVGHSADMQAIRECEVFSLPREDFEALMHQNPELIYKVMRAVIRTMLSILQRMDVQFVELTNYISKQHGRY